MPIQVRMLQGVVLAPGLIGHAGEVHSVPSSLGRLLVERGQAVEVRHAEPEARGAADGDREGATPPGGIQSGQAEVRTPDPEPASRDPETQREAEGRRRRGGR